MMSSLARPVAIVGAGFSGTMLALQLAERGIAAVLIDRAGAVGRGIAYGTDDPAHLLNVPAGKMSAWPDEPGDFAGESGLDAGAFARRRAYGDYLRGTLGPGGVELVDGQAVAATRTNAGWRIALDDGREVVAEALALATGNGRPAPFEVRGFPASAMLQDPWSGEAEARLAEAAAGGKPVLLIGTGLTMVDMVLTLDRLGHRGTITAVSRRGLVPRAHVPGVVPLPAPAVGEVPERLSDAVAWLRARGLGVDWRAAVDSLRPMSQALWENWPEERKARFVRHARPWWDVHRHRIAPEAAAVIERLAREGRLKVLAGRVGEGGDGSIAIALRGGEPITVAAELAVNCTGPSERLEASANPLLRQMLEDGLVEPGELGLGVRVDQAARAGEGLWAIGPLTKGRWWEITAVPDIRVQVGEVAAGIAAELA